MAKQKTTQELEDFIVFCIRELTKELHTSYFGCILSHLNLVNDNSIPEFAVSPNGDLVYNNTYAALHNEDTKRIMRDLVHEAGHIAFEHFSRKEILNVTGENHKSFNIAADCAIEAIFDKEFPYLPSDPVHHAGLAQHIERSLWDTMSTEQMYQTIYNPNPQSQDKQDSHIPILTPDGKQKLRSAMQQAKKEATEIIENGVIDQAATNTPRDPQKGKGAGTSQVTNDLIGLDPAVLNVTSFDAIRRLFKKSFGKGEDRDDSVFNQRQLLRRQFMGNALMGRHQRCGAELDGEVEQWHNDIVVFADVSGSMSQGAIKNGFKLLLRLAKEYGVEPMKVYTYNTSVQQSFVLDSSTDMLALNINIGGGTNINKAISEIKPDNTLVFVLTDMEDSPINKWDYSGKLVWLIHDNRNTNHSHFTIGERIYINDIIKG